MRLLAVINLPVILLAFVVGATAAPGAQGSTGGDGSSPMEGLFSLLRLLHFLLFNSTIANGPKVEIGGD